jgi:hypothetical protein
MDESQVPQDQSRTYGGHQKILYVKSDGGDYRAVTSSGWAAEEAATLAAVEELERLARESWLAANSGAVAPLQYHMYAQRMDIALLSKVTGLFQCRIRYHFKPHIFAKLSDELLTRYSNALGVDISALHQLPGEP